MRDDRPVASVAEVVRTYRVASGEVRAIRGVSAEFMPGAVSAVVGPSGSGKSTLLRLLAGIDLPTSGRVRVLEVDVDRASARARRRLRHGQVGYLFQRPSDNLFPHLTIAEHLRLARGGRRAPEGEIAAAIATLGLEGRLDHRPVELSGGEQQRAAVVLALVSGASVILADEPTAQLDRASGAELLTAIRGLTALGVAFVIATHDPQVWAGADEVVELDHGERVTRRRSAAAAPATATERDAAGFPVLVADGLTKTYHRGDELVHAVDDVSLTLDAQELVMLTGRSGSGKSTLLHMLAGWEPADAGAIGYLRDGAAPPPWSELAMLPQQLGLLEELTVRENVAYPARLIRRLPELDVTVDDLLERLGLAHLRDRYPRETSVGEQQRTSLARALVLSPSMLLADEPTGHQDAAWAATVLEELRRAVADGSGCLAATHDPLSRRYADRELAMADGRLIAPD